jgi:hypothetical protein
MPEPYVECNAPLRVTITLPGGGTCAGWVMGWRGQRIYVQWTAGVGLTHLGWLAAGAAAEPVVAPAPRLAFAYPARTGPAR